jgi:hypothetical protein
MTAGWVGWGGGPNVLTHVIPFTHTNL